MQLSEPNFSIKLSICPFFRIGFSKTILYEKEKKKIIFYSSLLL